MMYVTQAPEWAVTWYWTIQYIGCAFAVVFLIFWFWLAYYVKKNHHVPNWLEKILQKK